MSLNRTLEQENRRLRAQLHQPASAPSPRPSSRQSTPRENSHVARMVAELEAKCKRWEGAAESAVRYAHAWQKAATQ